jgi:hypothetical protein
MQWAQTNALDPTYGAAVRCKRVSSICRLAVLYTCLVTLRLQSAAQVMGALHPDQTRRHVREPCFDLAARPPLLPHDRAVPVEADDMERVLADVDAHRGNGQI